MIAIRITPSPLLLRAAALVRLWYALAGANYHDRRIHQARAGKIYARERGTLAKYEAYFDDIIDESTAELAVAHATIARIQSDLHSMGAQ